MKKVIVFTAILAILSASLVAQDRRKKEKVPVQTQDEFSEIELVKAAIDRESKAFFEIDYKTWAECWGHVPYAYWSFADTTDVNYFEGWESINHGFGDYFKTSKPSSAKMERKWNDVRVYGNAAYARFTQKVQDELGRDEQVEVRVLEKHNGEWKIVYVGVIARQKERRFN
jgi:hypothetical protein